MTINEHLSTISSAVTSLAGLMAPSPTKLATRVAGWEDELMARRAVELERIRHQLIQAVEQRYLHEEDQLDADRQT